MCYKHGNNFSFSGILVKVKNFCKNAVVATIKKQFENEPYDQILGLVSQVFLLNHPNLIYFASLVKKNCRENMINCHP